jgi:rhodanese-related sulfurtransferase
VECKSIIEVHTEPRLQVLDVSREREWEGDGHIEGASWWPLHNFKVAPPEIDRDVPMAVHCQGTYRSMIACRLLQWDVSRMR